MPKKKASWDLVNIRFGNEKEKVAQKLLIMIFDDQ
jgi:hypothetical protein